jgi:hypothetical protein
MDPTEARRVDIVLDSVGCKTLTDSINALAIYTAVRRLRGVLATLDHAAAF